MEILSSIGRWAVFAVSAGRIRIVESVVWLLDAATVIIVIA